MKWENYVAALWPREQDYIKSMKVIAMQRNINHKVNEFLPFCELYHEYWYSILRLLESWVGDLDYRLPKVNTFLKYKT